MEGRRPGTRRRRVAFVGLVTWAGLVGSGSSAAAQPVGDPAAAAAMAPVSEETTAAVVRSVGLVRSAGGVGSGWVAAPETVVTNMHVARAGSGDIYIDFSDGERVECYTAVGSLGVDLAILRCATGDRAAVGIDPRIPPAQTPVAVVGYPGGRGPTTSHGVITGLRQEVRSIDTIQFTAAIEPGSSGSPVFDAAGQVRGVATFGGGYGVPIGELQPLLDSAQSYPSTKVGAEWRLRIRRSVLAVVIVLPVVFAAAYRSGRNGPVRTAVKWALGGVVVALALTQVQFMFSGPAHLL